MVECLEVSFPKDWKMIADDKLTDAEKMVAAAKVRREAARITERINAEFVNSVLGVPRSEPEIDYTGSGVERLKVCDKHGSSDDIEGEFKEVDE